MDLLVTPEKITRKVNFMISRNGKPTTYRSKRSFISGETGVSGFESETLDIEEDITSVSEIKRTSELRLVINATFDFPDVDSPSFRSREFLRRIGAVPTATDIYNLVPWTWLLDWFTGLGSYIELIDNTNSDPSLINWAMITAESAGTLVTERSSKTRCRNIVTFDDVTTEDVYFRPYKHTSKFEYVCQIRRDVANSLDVNQTSVISSLTDYQKSILGALLAQRMDSTRTGTFRPRS
jgi:hypothetical protein